MPAAFATALTVVALWIMSGPIFHFSDTWQLVINTATTIITFLMVFLIQNSQNRDARAFHLKLDELIKGVRGARTEMVNLEELSDKELELMHDEFRTLHEKVAKQLSSRKGKHLP
jgi:low affinity Fe/Cu permease